MNDDELMKYQDWRIEFWIDLKSWNWMSLSLSLSDACLCLSLANSKQINTSASDSDRVTLTPVVSCHAMLWVVSHYMSCYMSQCQSDQAASMIQPSTVHSSSHISLRWSFLQVSTSCLVNTLLQQKQLSPLGLLEGSWSGSFSLVPPSSPGWSWRGSGSSGSIAKTAWPGLVPVQFGLANC